jgi:hypothetical protein
MRFHRRSNALLLTVTTTDAAVDAVQRVYVTPGVKQTNGSLGEAVVRLPGDPNGPLLLAGGPETGISVWAATGYEMWILLGEWRDIPLPGGRRIVLCRDDDKHNSPADKRFTRARAGLQLGEMVHHAPASRIARAGRYLVRIIRFPVRMLAGRVEIVEIVGQLDPERADIAGDGELHDPVQIRHVGRARQPLDDLDHRRLDAVQPEADWCVSQSSNTSCSSAAWTCSGVASGNRSTRIRATRSTCSM